MILLQILCFRGYTDQLIGSANATVLATSVVSSLCLGFLVTRIGKIVQVVKVIVKTECISLNSATF